MPFSDVKLFTCIHQAKAAYLVTGDADLLALKNFRGVKIITPRDFEALFD